MILIRKKITLYFWRFLVLIHLSSVHECISYFGNVYLLTLLVCIRPSRQPFQIQLVNSNDVAIEYQLLDMELQGKHSDLIWIPHKIQQNENDCKQLEIIYK